MQPSLMGATRSLEGHGACPAGVRGVALGDAELRHWVRAYCDPAAATVEERAWLEANPIEGWDVSRVTDMSHVFNGRRLFNADISGWDVSRVTTMAGMFANAAAFNQPIGAWDVGRVDNMMFMFYEASAFNQPIGGWDVGRVDNMMFMFYEASAFNQPIGGWNMRRVTNAHRMLDGADAFQQWVSGWSLDELSCPFFLQDLGEHRLRVAGVDLEWYPSQRGRQIDQWLRAHDMVVTVRRSIHHTILWGKLPEELVRAVGQWLGLDIMKCILP